MLYRTVEKDVILYDAEISKLEERIQDLCSKDLWVTHVRDPAGTVEFLRVELVVLLVLTRPATVLPARVK